MLATLFPKSPYETSNSVDDFFFMAKLSFSIQLDRLVFLVQLCAQTQNHSATEWIFAVESLESRMNVNTKTRLSE